MSSHQSGFYRSTSPATVRQVWDLVSQTKRDCISDVALFMEVMERKASHLYSWNKDELLSKLDAMVNESLLSADAQTLPTGARTIVYAIPASPLDRPEQRHDWYCFECHRAGIVKECSCCFRVYHDECVSAAAACLSRPLTERETSFVCPICQSTQKVYSMDPNLVRRLLDGMLEVVHAKLSAMLATLPPSGTDGLSPVQHRLLLARPMDLAAMVREKQLKLKKYTTPRYLLADVQLLVHNLAILHGARHKLVQDVQEVLAKLQTDVLTFEQHHTSVGTPYGYQLAEQKAPAILPTLAPKGEPQVFAGTSGTAFISGANGGMLAVLAPAPATVPLVATGENGAFGVKKEKKRKHKNDVAVGETSASGAGAPKKRKKATPMLGDADDSHVVSSSCETALNSQVTNEPSTSSAASVVSCNCADKFRTLMIELQKQWLADMKRDRERTLVQLAEELSKDFETDQERLRQECAQQTKIDMDALKNELDRSYTLKLQNEMQKIQEKHKVQIAETKRKQWCCQCGAEAIYHCCWNTSYCSIECQQHHWPQHRKPCRRKKQQQQQH